MKESKISPAISLAKGNIQESYQDFLQINRENQNFLNIKVLDVRIFLEKGGFLER
jgi:hypothetical protein